MKSMIIDSPSHKIMVTLVQNYMLITLILVFDGEQSKFNFMSPQQSIYGRRKLYEFKIAFPNLK